VKKPLQHSADRKKPTATKKKKGKNFVKKSSVYLKENGIFHQIPQLRTSLSML